MLAIIGRSYLVHQQPPTNYLVHQQLLGSSTTPNRVSPGSSLSVVLLALLYVNSPRSPLVHLMTLLRSIGRKWMHSFGLSFGIRPVISPMNIVPRSLIIACARFGWFAPSSPSAFSMNDSSFQGMSIRPSVYLINLCCCDENADRYSQLKSMPQRCVPILLVSLSETTLCLIIGLVDWSNIARLDKPTVIPLRMM